MPSSAHDRLLEATGTYVNVHLLKRQEKGTVQELRNINQRLTREKKLVIWVIFNSKRAKDLSGSDKSGCYLLGVHRKRREMVLGQAQEVAWGGGWVGATNRDRIHHGGVRSDSECHAPAKAGNADF